MPSELVEALANFNSEIVLANVNNRLNVGESPLDLVNECQQGMQLVGDRFSKGEYYLAELMLSADLFTQAMAVIEPKLEGMVQEKIGTMLIGTPKGDIHDLGKNIFTTLAKGAGFEVHDLGVDVPVEKFVEAVEFFEPDVLGFSALITTAFDPMKVVVDQLAEKGLREKLKVIVGGGVTNDNVRIFVGADAQVNDAVMGIKICKEFVT